MEGEAKVNNEIEEMLTALGDPTPENLKGDEEDDDKKEESSEDKKEEESKEEESSEEKEEDKKESSDESSEEEEKEEKEEEKEEEETDKDKIIENLRARLNEKPETPPAEKPKEESEEKPAEKKEEPLKLDEQDFIGDLDLDDLTRDKAALNKILNTVYAKGVNDSKRIATEGVLNTIPEIVKHNLTLLTTLKEASDNFYKENSDLVPFKRVVAAVFEEIAAKNPDKKYSELMNLTAPEARKRLELHKQAIAGEKKEKDKSPRLPNAKGGQRQSQSQRPNTSALEKEIADMNKSIGR
jgi:hypothetical protein